MLACSISFVYNAKNALGNFKKNLLCHHFRLSKGLYFLSMRNTFLG